MALIICTNVHKVKELVHAGKWFAQCPPNGLPITRAALLDREDIVADSNAQNRPDLVDAQRRRVHGRVSRQLWYWFTTIRHIHLDDALYPGLYVVTFFIELPFR